MILSSKDKSVTTMRLQTKFMILLFAALGFSLWQAPQSQAYDSPEDTSIYHTISLGATHGDGSRSNNLLYSPVTYLKVFSRNPSVTVTLLDIGQCASPSGYDSNSSGAPATQITARPYFSNGTSIDPNTTYRTQYNNGGNCAARNATIRLNATTSHRTSIIRNGERQYAFNIQVSFVTNAPGGWSSRDNGPLNAFRVTVGGANDGTGDAVVGAAQSNPANRPVAYLGRPISQTGRKDYNLKFGTPCSSSGGTTRVRLHWSDADFGTNYQPSDGSYYFGLFDYGTDYNNPRPSTGVQVAALHDGSVVNSNPVRRTVSGASLGGEGGAFNERWVEYDLQPGHKYEWVWRGVSDRNGVQVWYPFDHGNFYTSCPTANTNTGTCDASTVGGDVLAPNETFQTDFRVENTGGTVWPVLDDRNGMYYMSPSSDSPDNYGAQNELIRGDGVVNSGFGLVLYAQDPPGRLDESVHVTSWRGTGSMRAPPVSGDYSITWTIRIRGTGGPGIGFPCTQYFKVAAQPYHKVFGGDVLAGRGGDCAPDLNAGVIGWNNGSSGYTGAGTQLAAFALGAIDQFATKQPVTGGRPPDTLSFANEGSGYGGDFAPSSMPCVRSFWADDGGSTIASVTIGSVSSLASGAHRRDGNLTVNGGTLPLGRRVTVYVDGDLIIRNGIDYATNYNSVSQIPSIRFIVRGNIFVDTDVTTLNGLFVAMPSPGAPGATGVFYTCADGTATPATNTGMLATGCRQPLTVYGAVIADVIKLDRIRGTLRRASSNERWDNNDGEPAEKFIYSPELWLTSDFNGGDLNNSYGSLPPVL